MNKPQEETEPATISDAYIDIVLDEFGGDARAAIRALLEDIDTLARDHAQAVSLGYVRGRIALVK